MIIFTDGSTLCNGKKNACGGFAFYIPTQNGINEIVCSYALASTDKIKVTNNIAELLGAIIGIQTAINNMQTLDTIHVYTDSNYVIKAATDYSKKWISNNWKTANGKPVLNLWLVFHLIQLTKKYPIIFHHILAHTEKPAKESKEYILWKGNDIVDKLANSAASDLSNAGKTINILKWSNLACKITEWIKRDLSDIIPIPEQVITQIKLLLVPTQIVNISENDNNDDYKQYYKKHKSLKNTINQINDI